jgi:hypothetical protein
VDRRWCEPDRSAESRGRAPEFGSHPSAGVSAADRNDVAPRGVRAVEARPTPDSLARVLTRPFAPIAPQLVRPAVHM